MTKIFLSHLRQSGCIQHNLEYLHNGRQVRESKKPQVAPMIWKCFSSAGGITVWNKGCLWRVMALDGFIKLQSIFCFSGCDGGDLKVVNLGQKIFLPCLPYYPKNMGKRMLLFRWWLANPNYKQQLAVVSCSSEWIEWVLVLLWAASTI